MLYPILQEYSLLYSIVILITILLLFAIGTSFKRTILYRDIGSVKTAYLIRYTLFTCKYFSIKLHNVLISDEAELHNHPWNYISIILWSGYYEETYASGWYEGHIVKRFTWFPPLSIIKRKGNIAHRLILKNNKPCWSLIFTSEKYREWKYIKT